MLTSVAVSLVAAVGMSVVVVLVVAVGVAAPVPVAAVVPRFTQALMSRPHTDFSVSVFAKASHLMLEATRPSDDELEHLQRVAPGFYEYVSEWLKGRLARRADHRTVARGQK